jgi:hypothetical protein
MARLALDALPVSGDSRPFLYLTDRFFWALSVLSKDIEMPESIETSFAGFRGVRGAAYSAEDDNATVFVFLKAVPLS